MLDEMQQGVIRTSRDQAHYPYRKALGDVYYGLGWRVFDYGGAKGFVHHGGYVKGMCSTMVFHRESGTGMVLLTNSESRGMNELVLDFAAAHADRLKKIPLRFAKR
ncbi:MAG: serine hydrolase, partial [Proteobacteria bacterium]|nr:serine hydrolase [Pseudomonadota bacterium]